MILLAIELKGYHDIAMVIHNLNIKRSDQHGASTNAYRVTFELKHRYPLT